MTPTRPPRSLKLMHTSDLHLGCEYTGELPRRALRAVVDLALAEVADALFLAGDLFEHNRVPDAEPAFLLAQLARFGRPSFILPGNHDCFDAMSIYRRPRFGQRPGSVHVLADEGERCYLPSLDLEVWGRPVVEHCRAFRPLAGAPPRSPGSWRVAMAHGHFERPDSREPRSSPIYPEDIAASDSDYVALGHWDVHVDVSQGGVPAFYSGAPHHGRLDRGLAGVLMVTLDPVRGIGVERLSLG
jgi:DNA repair exonuclease SbcCD nuclease subunit